MPPKKKPETKSKPRAPSDSPFTLTKRESALLELIVATVLQKVTQLLTDLGITDATKHAQQHQDLQAVMPWIQARVKAEQKRAEFWSKLEKLAAHVLEKAVKDSAVFVMRGVLLLLVFLLSYGSGGKIREFVEFLLRLAGH